MYFPLMGTDVENKPWGYDRFDDIWAGIFAKKIMDHLGYGVINGSPFIEHRKASDPYKNLQKEAAGIEANEVIFKNVHAVKLTKKTPVEAYAELIKKVKLPNNPYFKTLKKAILVWLSLF